VYFELNHLGGFLGGYATTDCSPLFKRRLVYTAGILLSQRRSSLAHGWRLSFRNAHGLIRRVQRVSLALSRSRRAGPR
jgi:hypothetical protein